MLSAAAWAILVAAVVAAVGIWLNLRMLAHYRAAARRAQARAAALTKALQRLGYVVAIEEDGITLIPDPERVRDA